MVAIETTMGLLPQYFFPATAGRSYEPTAYLKYLEPFRDRLTVFSGVSHPLVDGGHSADISFLTGAPHPASGNFRNTISLDQFAAEALGPETRFPSLSLAVAAQGATSLSFTRDGVLIPGERSPARLHRQMFLQGDPQTTAERVESLRAGRSVLDYVGSGARKLERVASAEDRQRLEQYFTAVRDLEDRMQRAEVWERRRKPRPKAPPPPEAPEQELFTLLRLMGRMIRMALETDSTRIVTLFVNPAQWVPRAPGVAHETHSLTHHGNRPEMIEELRTVEEQQFALLGELLAGLDEVREGQPPSRVLHIRNRHRRTPSFLRGAGWWSGSPPRWRWCAGGWRSIRPRSAGVRPFQAPTRWPRWRPRCSSGSPGTAPLPLWRSTLPTLPSPKYPGEFSTG